MPDNNLPSWRQDLKSSRKKEGKSPSNRWIQLATVSEENEPRLRTVVFRGWHKDSSMIIFTDRRSEKIGHLKSNPNAEILWFFFRKKAKVSFKVVLPALPVIPIILPLYKFLFLFANSFR